MQHIVVIEEDALMRDLLVEWLRAEGYDVDAPCAGRTAQPPSADLVIVDLQAPRQEGATTVRAVQRDYPHAPVIAMSGSFHAQVAAEGSTARALGARRVIAKPFHRQDMIEAVRAVIGPAH